MTPPNPNWPLTKTLHSLRGAHLLVVPYKAKNPASPDNCLFCSKVLGGFEPHEERPLAYTADGELWVCMACFCEHKDDFDWPTSE